MSCNCSPQVLPAYYIGTTWPGMTGGTITFSYAEAATLAKLVLVFSKDGVVGLTLDSSLPLSPVTVSAPWKYEVANITPLALAEGDWTITFYATDSTGYIRQLGIYNQQIL